MGIREKLNDNPAYTTGGTIAIIVIALGFIIWQLVPSHPNIPTQSYFSDDDGVSYFADDIKKIAPFDHAGKEAVRCYVFKCASGGKFVGYLEKYTPAAKKMMEQAASKPNAGFDPAVEMAQMTGLVVKKPGKGTWVSERNPQVYQSIINVVCPSGGTDMEPVMP